MDVYTVVGCSDCEALWVVEGRPETTGCPRCGSRHRFGRLRTFVTTDDEDHAREVRSAMLARRRDEETADGLETYAEMAAAIDGVGPSDEEYLKAGGVDPDAVAAAGERATEGQSSRSRREIVRDALEILDRPDEAAVVEYASERGVPSEYVRRALERLLRAGEITRTDEGLRPL